MNPLENTEIPSWYNEAGFKESLDAREMLDRGEHPLSIVLEKAGNLSKGEIFELITPFPPMPLIEKVKALGLESYSRQVSGSDFRTYFCK